MNMAGEVIGINTAILTDTNAYAGVGFALPSNTVAQVYNQLVGPDHRVSRGSIGIMFNALDNPAIARVYGTGSGVTISDVTPGSPAEQAGLKVGDTIVSVDGKSVKNGDELVSDIAARKPGSKIAVGFIRNGKKQEVTATVADRAKLFAARLGDEDEGGPESGPKESKLGVSVRTLTQEMADRLDVPAAKGVIVKDVKTGSFAEDVGTESRRHHPRDQQAAGGQRRPVHPRFRHVEERTGCRIPGTPAGRRPRRWNHLSGRYTSVTRSWHKGGWIGRQAMVYPACSDHELVEGPSRELLRATILRLGGSISTTWLSAGCVVLLACGAVSAQTNSQSPTQPTAATDQLGKLQRSSAQSHLPQEQEVTQEPQNRPWAAEDRSCTRPRNPGSADSRALSRWHCLRNLGRKIAGRNAALPAGQRLAKQIGSRFPRLDQDGTGSRPRASAESGKRNDVAAPRHPRRTKAATRRRQSATSASNLKS